MPILPLTKKIITFLILVSFLAVAFFSFAVMTYSPNGRMADNCLLSAAMGASLCPEDVLNVAVHHISAYYSFFNILISLGVLVLLIFGSLFSPFSPLLVVRYHASPPEYFRQKKKVHWLALLENSR